MAGIGHLSSGQLIQTRLPVMMSVFTALLVLIFLLPGCHCVSVDGVVDIQCDEDPLTGVINVTYLGDAELIYPMDNMTEISTCPGVYREDGTYLLVDVNHRECGFWRLRNTNTWTMKLKLQRKSELETALDKEYYVSCVYNDFQFGESVPAVIATD